MGTFPGRFWLLLALLLAPAARGAEADQVPRDPSAPPGIVSAIDGRPIDIEALRGFLLTARAPGPRGSAASTDSGLTADRPLLEAEAKRLGISVPYQTVEREARVEEEAAAALLGGKEGYRAYLEWLGVGPEEEAERVRARTLERLVVDACIVKTRAVTEEEARLRFGAVAARRGWQDRAFEEVRGEVMRELRERPPLPRERIAFLERLRREEAARRSAARAGEGVEGERTAGKAGPAAGAPLPEPQGPPAPVASKPQASPADSSPPPAPPATPR